MNNCLSQIHVTAATECSACLVLKSGNCLIFQRFSSISLPLWLSANFLPLFLHSHYDQQHYLVNVYITTDAILVAYFT